MNYNRLRFIILFIVSLALFDCPAQDYYVNVRSLNAYGDNRANDTKAIQTAIDKVSAAGGGTVFLPAGHYLVDSLKLGIKTSLIGEGTGATVIRQTQGSQSNCLIISEESAAFVISHITFYGNGNNCGIYMEPSNNNGEHQEYIYTLTNKWNQKQGYKWINIDDVCIYGFDIGILFTSYGFNTTICNSTVGMNGDGVILKNSDSSIYNCYINNNRRNGLWILGGNNKASNIKSIFNGIEKGSKYAAVLVDGNRCQLDHIETQDNYCKGFWIRGSQNIITGCISNTDGYSKDGFKYSEEVNGYGFHISQLNNLFSNCLVTSYIDRYGAIFKSPLKIDENIEYAYPNILKDIRIIHDTNRPFFNEPLSMERNGATNTDLRGGIIRNIDGCGNYLTANNVDAAYLLCRKDYDYNHLNTIVDFRIEKFDKWARLWSVGDGNGALELVLVHENSKTFLCLYAPPVINCALEVSDSDSILNKDIRVKTSFERINGNIHACVQAYLKHEKNGGWMKHSAFQKIDGSDIKKIASAASYVRLGKEATAMNIKRLVMSYSPIEDTLLIPGADISSLSAYSFLYFDADTYKDIYFRTSGPTSKRPSLTRFDTGYQYFDTSLGVPVYWNGEKWIDVRE